MGWRQFVMHLEQLEPERVEEILDRHGALAVTLTDAADEPVLEPAPGETPLWGQTRITGLFSIDADFDALALDLLASLGVDFRPMRFGRRLWVCPSGHEVSDLNAVVIRLDPGLAFGTGTHPTTALCLAFLDSESLEGRRVLDYGCGSGVLAIAALLLGAASATGVDIDPQALVAADSNAVANGVGGRLALLPGGADCGTGYDVVVANILARPLIEMAPRLVASIAPGGRLALSGILTNQAGAVQAAYDAWIDFDPPRGSDDWVLLTGTKQ
jgi:ribosomal protein L11 methyltransferase